MWPWHMRICPCSAKAAASNNGLALEPFAGLTYVHVSTGGNGESGGLAALRAGASLWSGPYN